MTLGRLLPSVVIAALALPTALSVHASQRAPQPGAAGPAGARPAVVTVAAVPPPATRLEAMLASPSALATRDLYRVTDRCPALRPDHRRRRRQRCLAHPGPSTRPPSRSARSGPPERPRTSYVDQGELAGLSQALGQMIAVASQWTGREDSRATEAQFATVGGFIVGFHQDSRNQSGYVIAGVVDPARHACAVRDFAVIKTAIDSAIGLLKDK